MAEDERLLLPVLYTTIRTSGNPLDMVIADEESVKVTANNLSLRPLSSRPPDVPSFIRKLTLFSKMQLSSLFLILAACAIGFASAAVTPHALARRSFHHGALQPFQKRASGQFTFFAVGMGACGKQNTNDDFVSIPPSFTPCGRSTLFAQIVALNTPVNASSPYLIPLSLTAVNSLGLEALIVSRQLRLTSTARRLKPKSLTGLVDRFALFLLFPPLTVTAVCELRPRGLGFQPRPLPSLWRHRGARCFARNLALRCWRSQPEFDPQTIALFDQH